MPSGSPNRSTTSATNPSRAPRHAVICCRTAAHSASISTKMLKELGGATLIGPMLVGLTHSVQICPLGAKDSDVVNMAALAAYDING